jgi:predicted 3-demethylubiquinone-9 3-methyltransferase (glyoxalase superfamily)
VLWTKKVREAQRRAAAGVTERDKMAVMPIVTPFLMFQGRAEEALRFYTELIPGSRITRLDLHGADGPGAEGTVAQGEAVLGELAVRFIDSPAVHAFSFTPSMSLFITCDTAAEVDRLTSALADGGETLMPLGDYGFSPRFAWVNDRFGVSWQISVG